MIMIRTVIDKTLDCLLILNLGLMTLVIAANVFFRFVLNQSIPWADELAMILLVWLTFLGAAVAVRERTHYVFAYLIHKLRGRTLKVYILSRNLTMIFAILILGFYSTQITAGITDWIMPALEISRAYVYAAAPAGSLFMLYYSIDLMIRDWKDPHRVIPTEGIKETGLST